MRKFIRLDVYAPALFVFLWSTGWVVATYADPHSDPLTFLSVRFFTAIILFCLIAVWMGAKWPTTRIGWFHALISGVFLHAIYLGGVWWAIEKGVPTSISGLLAALQPLLTALIAWWAVKEKLSTTQKLGLLIGFSGLAIAILPGLVALESSALLAASGPLAVNAIAMLAVTIGTIYQKRFLQTGDLVPVVALQYSGALVVMVPFALILEPQLRFDWTLQNVAAMIWSVFALSLGAILLLLFLIRRGQVSRAASLIYLVPPAVGLEAWLLFGETPDAPFLIGTAVVVVGVWLINRNRPNGAIPKSTEIPS